LAQLTKRFKFNSERADFNVSRDTMFPRQVIQTRTDNQTSIENTMQKTHK